MIELLKLITGLIILSYASYTDIKTRRASNKLWVIMATIGIIFIIYNFIINEVDYILLIILGIMLLLFYVLFQSKIIYGGADAKALMALSFLISYHVFTVWFFALLFTMLTVPFLYLYYHSKKSFKDLIITYKHPFIVSILFGFVSVMILGFDIFKIIIQT